ncbi:MAG: Gfo/Idh/MocA family oxidoreductase [Thermofilaceae archaeon]|nr:Gfo/Idh/MocA family oxidoreductase [Thermofilaceae archaeon]MCX8180291.1 Gfo/Idh/MocA family oxidoreductase [Thermofilaceae archaeon]MDW8003826.1 Gfo/Idh/MocA family oxidoreductase [Thermofilaceae archaeon]
MGGLGVAVIGCGFISGVHLRAWKKIPDVKLLAVVDVIEGKAKKAAQDFDVPHRFTDYHKVLDMKDVEIVDICTPTYTHAEIAIAAAKNGKHVLVEKPIALKLREADEMIEAARKAGVKFMVAHCLRWWPEYVEAKQLVENGAIGEPRIARAYRHSSFPEWTFWHKDRRLSGGVFVDMSIHDVDYLRWVLGEVEEVYARGGVLKTPDSTSHDYTHAILKFRDGAIAYVEGSWIQPVGFPFSTYLEIVGTKGMLTVDSQSPASLRIYKPNMPPAIYTHFEEDAYDKEIRHFYECVSEDREPAVTGEEARKTLEVVLAAVKSVDSGRPVRLPLEGEVI